MLGQPRQQIAKGLYRTFPSCFYQEITTAAVSVQIEMRGHENGSLKAITIEQRHKYFLVVEDFSDLLSVDGN